MLKSSLSSLTSIQRVAYVWSVTIIIVYRKSIHSQICLVFCMKTTILKSKQSCCNGQGCLEYACIQWYVFRTIYNFNLTLVKKTVLIICCWLMYSHPFFKWPVILTICRSFVSEKLQMIYIRIRPPI